LKVVLLLEMENMLVVKWTLKTKCMRVQGCTANHLDKSALLVTA